MGYIDKIIIGVVVLSGLALAIIFTGSIWALTASMVIS